MNIFKGLSVRVRSLVNIYICAMYHTQRPYVADKKLLIYPKINDGYHSCKCFPF
jgi:hypothetical protein